MPLRRGHCLVIPKAHYTRLSELPLDLASAVGEAVTVVANALVKALGNTALNVVCNQEYAQAVPHVHYHIIPAPELNNPGRVATTSDNNKPLSKRQMHQMEFASRHELEDGDADPLLKRLRAHL